MKMRAIVSLSIFLSSSVLALTGECDTEYIEHNDRVMKLITSRDATKVALGAAQRDCLAQSFQTLKTGASLCPTFRLFEKAFISLSVDTQISNGEKCFNKLLNL